MSQDIKQLIERLRFQTHYTVGQVPVTMLEAEDALERLQAENERLKADLAEAKHTEAYWLHEKTMALAEGYGKGRASALCSQYEFQCWELVEKQKYILQLERSPQAAPQSSQQAEPVEFLLGGNRLKLSFQQRECEHCGSASTHFRTVPIDQYAEELQGRWVALVPAENDRHLGIGQIVARLQAQVDAAIKDAGEISEQWVKAQAERDELVKTLKLVRQFTKEYSPQGYVVISIDAALAKIEGSK